MNARDRILGKLRAAAPSATPVVPDVLNHFALRSSPRSLNQRVHALQSALEAAHADVLRVTRATLAPTLVQIAHQKGLNKIAVGERVHQPTADDGLAPVVKPALAQLPSVKVYDQPVDAWKAELFNEMDAGITLCRGGIAETGTLIVWPTQNEPRLLSLVPPVHIAVLDAEHIHETFFDAMHREGWGNIGVGRLPTNALLISGPSKTADIQQTLAYGAHGPKELIVLICMPEGGAQ